MCTLANKLNSSHRNSSCTNATIKTSYVQSINVNMNYWNCISARCMQHTIIFIVLDIDATAVKCGLFHIKMEWKERNAPRKARKPGRQRKGKEIKTTDCTMFILKAWNWTKLNDMSFWILNDKPFTKLLLNLLGLSIEWRIL